MQDENDILYALSKRTDLSADALRLALHIISLNKAGLRFSFGHGRTPGLQEIFWSHILNMDGRINHPQDWVGLVEIVETEISKPSQDRPHIVIPESAVRTEPVRKKDDFSEEFEAMWKLYPKREGGNPKGAAWKAWQARLKEGHTATELLRAAKRYARYCQAQGKWGTPFVAQAMTFYGPAKRLYEEWLTDESEDTDGPAWAEKQKRFTEQNVKTETTSEKWEVRKNDRAK